MLDALTLDQIRVFLAVAEAGSFRSAANRVKRAQSAVSHAIASLEAQLGVTLFDRSGHRPVLTSEGQALLADGRAVILKVDAMRARAQGLGQGVELELALFADPVFPAHRLAAALGELHAAFPSVSLRIRSETLGGPLLAVQEGRASLGITLSEEINDPRVRLEWLGNVRLLAVASPAHPLAQMLGRIEAVTLADHLQIVLSDPSPVTEGRDFGVLSPGTWRVGDLETKRALLIAGVGWGSLPERMVAAGLAAGRLVRIAPAALGSDGETLVPAFIAHRTDAALGPVARFLRERLLPNQRP